MAVPVEQASASSRDFRALRRVLGFVRPYWLAVVGAMLALVIAAGTVLALGQGLRQLVDHGFRSGDVATLDGAVLVLIVVVIVLAAATFCRF